MTKEKNIGDRVFWGTAISISLMGLIYLSVFALVNKNLVVGILALVFTGMWAGALSLGFIVGKDYDILNYGTLFGNVSMFFTGLILYTVINLFIMRSGNLSVFTVSANTLYSTVASEIPRNIDFLMTAFVIPTVEELLWIFAIPVTILTLMNSMKQKFSWMGNPFLQLFVIVVIGGYTFAIFHVGKTTLLVFVVSAILFRSLMLISVYSDWIFDSIPFLELTPALALGSHIGNNLTVFGWGNAWNMIVTNMGTTGWIVLVVFGSMLLVMLNGLGEKLSEVSKI